MCDGKALHVDVTLYGLERFQEAFTNNEAFFFIQNFKWCIIKYKLNFILKEKKLN